MDSLHCNLTLASLFLSFTFSKMKATDLNRFTIKELDAMALFIEEFYPEFLDYISDFGLDQDFAEKVLEKLNCACVRSDNPGLN